VSLLSVALLKLRRRPATWVVSLILIGLIALVFAALGLSAGQSERLGERMQVDLLLRFPAAYTVVAGMILSLGGLLAVAYGAAVIGADWAWGTIRAIIGRGEGRVRYALTTFAAVAIVLALIVLVTFAIGAVVAILAADAAGLGSAGATDPDTLADLPALVARTWLGVTEEAAIGFAIAMIFRSQLAGIGAGVALYFAEAFLFLVPMFRGVLVYFPFSVASAMVPATDLGGGGLGATSTLDPDSALVWVVAYLVLALTVAATALWRAQITR
jgi:ABC-2 type transport system permease protein